MGVTQRQGTFVGKGDLKLFYQAWLPEQPVGSMVIAHGAGEHSGRYLHVGSFFAERGLAVYALDYRGHGRSEGTRLHVESLEEYIQDLHTFIGLVTDHQAALGKPVLVGHSMGGLVALACAETHPGSVRALVLSSPWLATRQPPTPVEQFLSNLFDRLWPHGRIPRTIAVSACTRDPEMAAAYENDPLRTPKGTWRWARRMLDSQLRVCAGARNLQVSSLWLQAGEDRLVDPETTQAAYRLVGYPDKTFFLYDDSYHELFNEPPAHRARVLADVEHWLCERGILPAGG